MTQLFKYLKESLIPVFSKEEHQRFKLASVKGLFPYIKPHWKRALIGSLFMIVLSLLALPSPYLMKLIFDKVLVDKNIELLNLIIISLIGFQLTRVIFSILTDYHFNLFSQEIMVRIKKDLFYRILRLPLSFFDKNQTGYILSRIGEVEGLNIFFSSALTSIVITLFEFVFCLSILFYLNWKLTLISLIILPIYYIATKSYSRGIRKLSRETYEMGAEISRQIQDSLSGVDVIKYFTAEKRETDKIHNYLDEFKEISIRRNIIFTFSSELLALLGAFGGFVVLWYSGLDIIKGSFTVGSYIAFSAYIGKLYGPTQMFASLGLSFQPAAVALDRVSELMELAGEEESETGIRIKYINREIEFKNVFFSYGTKQVLSDINFRIKKGDKVILAGPNGSGKSTIIKLILGLYRVKKGLILIDSQDINKISKFSLRERISVVSKNTFLFNDTIRNNILYSKPEATGKEIEEAAALAGALDFIKRYEAEFDTEVGEKGIRLSGGEKQKISIARAILKDSDVMIFDEATAHLDRQSEEKIIKLIEDVFQDKICIVVSHKMRWNCRFDKIYLLENGEHIDEIEPRKRS